MAAQTLVDLRLRAFPLRSYETLGPTKQWAAVFSHLANNECLWSDRNCARLRGYDSARDGTLILLESTVWCF